MTTYNVEWRPSRKPFVLYKHKRRKKHHKHHSLDDNKGKDEEEADNAYKRKRLSSSASPHPDHVYLIGGGGHHSLTSSSSSLSGLGSSEEIDLSNKTSSNGMSFKASATAQVNASGFDFGEGGDGASGEGLEHEVHILRRAVDVLMRRVSTLENELRYYKRIPAKMDIVGILPPELSIMILSWLGSSDINAASRVSENWYALTNDNLLWHRLILRAWPNQTRVGVGGQKKVSWKAVYRRVVTYEKNIMKGHIVASRKLDHMHGLRDEERASKNVYAVKFDDKFILSGGNNNLLRVWSASRSTKCLQVLKGHTDFVWCLDFEGTTACSGGRDAVIKIWDIETGQSVSTFAAQGPERWIRCLKQKGPVLVSGAEDCIVRIWDVRTGAVQHTLAGHKGLISCLQFDEKKIISGSSRDCTFRFWDIRKLSSEKSSTGGGSGSSAGGGSDTAAAPKSGSGAGSACYRTIEMTRRAPNAFQYSDETGYLISGNSDKSITVYDLNSGEFLTNALNCHDRYVWTLQFDSNKLITGGYDGKIGVWKVVRGEGLDGKETWTLHRMCTMPTTKAWVSSLMFEGSRIVHGNGNYVYVWDFEDIYPTSSAS
jgi:WD40 repeat protein